MFQPNSSSDTLQSLTSGDWDVTEILTYNEETQLVWALTAKLQDTFHMLFLEKLVFWLSALRLQIFPEHRGRSETTTSVQVAQAAPHRFTVHLMSVERWWRRRVVFQRVHHRLLQQTLFILRVQLRLRQRHLQPRLQLLSPRLQRSAAFARAQFRSWPGVDLRAHGSREKSA